VPKIKKIIRFKISIVFHSARCKCSTECIENGECIAYLTDTCHNNNPSLPVFSPDQKRMLEIHMYRIFHNPVEYCTTRNSIIANMKSEKAMLAKLEEKSVSYRYTYNASQNNARSRDCSYEKITIILCICIELIFY
jgi:hypothetical protein